MIHRVKVYAKVKILGEERRRVSVGIANYNTETRTVLVVLTAVPTMWDGVLTTEVPAKWERARRPK